ncbi:MAG: hypothetical protein HQK53_07365 [Oligoflexia bacterium]|nr:hypothetical protein [Oligoflexia bacterium]
MQTTKTSVLEPVAESVPETVKLETVQLITKGFLGSCWYGKYHYLEPWIGCEHNCHYCYARSRKIIQNSLALHALPFARTALYYSSLDKLLQTIQMELQQEQVKILKLCRYTDIFTPSRVTDGTANAVLKTICEKSAVERIIITTKGIPNQEIIRLMGQHPERFSYNSVILPSSEDPLHLHANVQSEQIKTAAEIKALGIKTTIHFDPICYSIFDTSSQWEDFLIKFKTASLNRVMFSYMMLDEIMKKNLAEKLDPALFQQLLSIFDKQTTVDYSFVDEKTYYMDATIRQKHIELLAALLTKHQFEFTLCSIKSVRGVDLKSSNSNCPACTGDFYA